MHVQMSRFGEQSQALSTTVGDELQELSKCRKLLMHACTLENKERSLRIHCIQNAQQN